MNLEHKVWLGAAEEARFPLRVAALDMGSNAIRFTAAEFSDPDHFVELEAQRFSVRLGHDAFGAGALSDPTLEAAVEAVVRVRQRLDDHGIGRYRAVATSAVRESRNGGALVERIRKESGIHLETITGSEEARLVWVAVRHRVPLGDGEWILADLGGGSMEVSLIGGEGIRASDSHPMGTVRLLEDLAEGADHPGTFRDLAERYVSRLSLPEGMGRMIAGVVVTGGNAEALADLLGAPRGARGVSEITRTQVENVIDRLAGMTVAERIHRLGLREDRADVILPAAIIFNRVATLSDCDRIIVPRVGVKDGLLYDLVADLVGHREHESEMDRLALTGAIGLGRRYRFDEAHARHVRKLSLSLFDQMQSVHRLSEASRRRLSIAALLHDVGQFIGHRRHHKHSWYVMMNAEIPGLSPIDTRIAALVARYHRRSEPKEEHEGYADLAADEKLEVRQLASLLRLADALDREHRRHVRDVAVSINGRTLTLGIDSGGDTSLERWAMRERAPMFERVFGLELRLG